MRHHLLLLVLSSHHGRWVVGGGRRSSWKGTAVLGRWRDHVSGRLLHEGWLRGYHVTHLRIYWPSGTCHELLLGRLHRVEVLPRRQLVCLTLCHELLLTLMLKEIGAPCTTTVRHLALHLSY